MRRSFPKLCRMHSHTLIKVLQHQRMNRIDQHCLTKLRFLITRTSDSVSSSANANAATKKQDGRYEQYRHNRLCRSAIHPSVPDSVRLPCRAPPRSTARSLPPAGVDGNRCTSSSSGLRPVTNNRYTNSTSAMHVSTIARWSTPVICVFCVSHSALMGQPVRP